MSLLYTKLVQKALYQWKLHKQKLQKQKALIAYGHAMRLLIIITK